MWSIHFSYIQVLFHKVLILIHCKYLHNYLIENYAFLGKTDDKSNQSHARNNFRIRQFHLSSQFCSRNITITVMFFSLSLALSDDEDNRMTERNDYIGSKSRTNRKYPEWLITIKTKQLCLWDSRKCSESIESIRQKILKTS